MSNRIKPEVLAPAGDFERLQAAVKYGADAVYLGATSFGMRANAGNFNEEELRAGVQYAHEHGVRVYLTCNILPTNEEADQLEEFLLRAADAGVDALIVADVGILMMAHRLVPQIDIHISTQTGVVTILPPTSCTSWVPSGWFWPGNSRWRLSGRSGSAPLRTWRSSALYTAPCVCPSRGGACSPTTSPGGMPTAANAPSPAAGAIISWRKSVPDNISPSLRTSMAPTFSMPRICR